MANFGSAEILIILAVVLLLFGSAKLPQLARCTAWSTTASRSSPRNPSATATPAGSWRR
ncbi:twin-arginine translocase TatA/TatE family subunit [Actinomadura rudentiformis]|uniref:Twin-arginine translocase TatA/TatE family subunit n=1 Tax=Actinomadura rudentiformis TaxID=359158 RepID=A0A6H9YT29_9ACTN|nr:twin-arginine translocase TatA/TatE family subunit [Actinomadura rudentiformis]KAB2350041.1 hypothetical protein F8566_09435 [Actinomadura rudentiformis]